MIQLIYVSAAQDGVSEEALPEFLDANRRRNTERGITGIVVYHKGSFLQVLEGPGPVIDGLFDVIRQDPRHDAVTLLSRKSIKHREFGNAAMAFVDTTGKGHELDGFVDYESDLANLTLGDGQARRLLAKFLEGKWHQHLMQ
jgi:hypothetical protein